MVRKLISGGPFPLPAVDASQEKNLLKAEKKKTQRPEKRNKKREFYAWKGEPRGEAQTKLVHAELKGLGRPVCGRLGMLWLGCAALLMPAAADANALSVASVSSVRPCRSHLMSGGVAVSIVGAPIGATIGNSSALRAAPWAAADGLMSSAGRCVAAADDFMSSAGRRAAGLAELHAAAGNISVPWLHFHLNMWQVWFLQLCPVSQFANLEPLNVSFPLVCVGFLWALSYLSWRDICAIASGIGWLFLWIPNPWTNSEPDSNLVWLILVYLGMCLSDWPAPSLANCGEQETRVHNPNSLQSNSVWNLSWRDLTAFARLVGWISIFVPNPWYSQEPLLLSCVYFFAGLGFGSRNNAHSVYCGYREQKPKRMRTVDDVRGSEAFVVGT